VIAGISGGILFVGTLVGVALYVNRHNRRRNAAREFEQSKIGNVVQATTASKLPEEAVTRKEQEEDTPQVSAI